MGFKWNRLHKLKCVHRDLQDKRRRKRRSQDSAVLPKLYAWFVLIITVTVVIFSCPKITIAEAEATITIPTILNPLVKISNLTLSTSTVRPWPSHEFFQAVINNNLLSISNSTPTEFTQTVQNYHQSSSVQSSHNFAKALTSNQSKIFENKTESFFDPVEISPTKIISNDTSRLDRDLVFTNYDRYLASTESESRHWVSLTPPSISTSTRRQEEIFKKKSRLSSTVSSNDELPFKVIAKQTLLSPEFYKKLSGEQLSSPIATHDKLPFLTTKNQYNWSPSSALQNFKIQNKPHDDEDYVNDEPSHGWGHEEEENQSYVPAPTKPPDFTRITWPYSHGWYSKAPTSTSSTTRSLETQFPILSSYSKYTKTTTSYPTTIFPILQHTTSKPPVIIASYNHWGSSSSSGSVEAVKKPEFPLRVNSGSSISSVFTFTRRPSTDPKVTIKILSDITTTSTDISTNANLNVKAETQHNVEFQTDNPNKYENEENYTLQNESVSNGFKAPTNLWYKPTINHHYNSNTFGNYHAQSNGMNTNNSNVNNTYNNTPIPILAHPQNNLPNTDNLTTAEMNNMETKHPLIEQYFPQILFKIWKYTNGTLELANAKIIPNSLLKDYSIKEDCVLNMHELPHAIQRIVGETIILNGRNMAESHDDDDDDNDEEELPKEKRQGFESNWEEMPIIHAGSNGQIQILNNRRKPQYHGDLMGNLKRKPVTLNYILWNPPGSSMPTVTVKTPLGFVINNHKNTNDATTVLGPSGDNFYPPQPQQMHGEGNSHQLFLPNKPQTQDSNWNALKTYLKQQATQTQTKLPSYLPDYSNSQSPPTIFSNYHDKDISNVAAVSLILSYLNKEKNNNFHGDSSYTPTTQSPAESLSALLTPQNNDPRWDALRPVLQHLLQSQNSKNKEPNQAYRPPLPAFSTADRINSYLDFASSLDVTEHTTPTALNRFPLAMSDLNFIPNNFIKTTSKPIAILATEIGTTTEHPPPRRKSTRTPRPKLRYRQNHRSTTTPSAPALKKKGETSEYDLEDPNQNFDDPDLTKTLLTKIAKKKAKKKLQKLKKKGWYDFDINFDIGLDIADIIKRKVLGILALKYAPFLVLALATIAPTLLLCFPWILKAWKQKLVGSGQHTHHTYVYPYTYAYPVSDNSYESHHHHDFDNGWGWGKGKSNKGSPEVHHHFHDLPSTTVYHSLKANPYEETSHYIGDYSDYSNSYETKPIADQSQSSLHQNYGNGKNPSNIYDSIASQPYISVTVPAAPITPLPAILPQQFAHEFSEGNQNPNEYQNEEWKPINNPFPLENYQAESYMKRIREIGRNLGKIIGSQISDVGNQNAMQVILDSKKESLNKMLHKLNIFKAENFIPQLRDSEEDNDSDSLYRRKSAHFRKRRRRSLFHF